MCFLLWILKQWYFLGHNKIIINKNYFINSLTKSTTDFSSTTIFLTRNHKQYHNNIHHSHVDSDEWTTLLLLPRASQSRNMAAVK